MDSIPLFRCGKCGEHKPLSAFHKGRLTGGRHSWCKTCKNKGTPRVMPKLGPRTNLQGERHTTWTVISWCVGEKVWLCRCDCGREKKLNAWKWRARVGNRACTCNGTERPKLPPGEAVFNIIYHNYRGKAERRGLEFNLTREEFRELVEQPCAYCGSPPSQTRSAGERLTPFTYSGIDRVDPSAGYSLDNCRPCCKYCNYAKTDLSLSDWLEHVNRIYNHMHLGGA